MNRKKLDAALEELFLQLAAATTKVRTYREHVTGTPLKQIGAFARVLSADLGALVANIDSSYKATVRALTEVEA
jgi:hypothetical protein